MDRKLLDYLPPVLREVDDFQVINEANEPEISLAWDCLGRVMANQFLEDADDVGVSVWEQELCIRPKGTDTLELRKSRIRAMWNRELPYTLPWLQRWLAGVCGGEAVLEESGYRLRVQTGGTEIPADLKAMIKQAIPANLLYVYAVSFQGGASTLERLSTVSLIIRSRIFNLRGIPPVCFDGSMDFGGELFFDQQLASTAYQAPVLFDGGQTFGGSISFDRQVAGSFRTIALLVRAGTHTANRPGFPGTVCRGGTEFREKTRASPGTRVRAASPEGLRPRRITVRTCTRTTNTVAAVLRVNTLYEFAGAYGFDGERRFNADIIDL